MNELDLLKLIKNNFANNSYIGDDTAYLEELGIVVTTDTLIEDVHFRLKTTTPLDLGFKSIAVNLSDIASDGAIPAYAFISLSLPDYCDEKFVEEFYKGMNELCVRHGVTVAGGDLTKADKLFINISLIGKTEGLSPARRNNAKVGDVVIATGFYGTSKAGFEILENEEKFAEAFPDVILERFKEAHRKPEPHLGFGRIILQNSKTTPAMMDTSDGLADALFKIAQSSKVEIEVNENLIPIDNDLKEVAKIINAEPLDWILFGGEDYTLVATVDEEVANKLAVKNIPIRKIGKVVNNNDNGLVKILSNDKTVIINEETLLNKTFQHFNR
ncbi:MAG: thiamine-phosphate kinase [Candidatus Gastranaerophilales bacterium]|nr:thiamine-phosphate kinase [Candidatus Gastranaerophilales bacterium]